MDPQASHKRAFESETPPSSPPTHPPPLPYLQPYSPVLFTPSHIPRSQSSEFVQLSQRTSPLHSGYQAPVRPSSPLRDSPTAEPLVPTPTLPTSGYGAAHPGSVSIRPFEISGALNTLPIEYNRSRSGSSVSKRATRQTQKTFHSCAVEYPLEHPHANSYGTRSFRRVTSEHSNVDLKNSEYEFVNDLSSRHLVRDMDETCSGCSRSSGEFNFTAKFSLDSVPRGVHLRDDGLAIPTPLVPNAFQEVERPNYTPTPSSVSFFGSGVAPAVAEPYRLPRSQPLGRAGSFSQFPAAEAINLNESDTFFAVHPTAQHCGGCILCTPCPSPRISAVGSTRNGGGNPLLAHSDQSASPPPTNPLPVLGALELAALQDIASSPTAVGSPDISMSSVKGDAQAAYHKTRLADRLRPGLEDRIPCRRLRRRRSGYFLPAAGTTGGVCLRSDPFYDDINDLSCSEPDPHNEPASEPRPESPCEKGSLHSHRTTSSVSRVGPFQKEQLSRLTFINPSSSLEQIRVNTRGLDRYEPRKKSPLPTPIPPNRMGESSLGRKRPSWTASVFGNWDQPTPTSQMSTGFVMNGVPRRPTRPHAGERSDRRLSGASGSHELADPGTTNVSGVAIDTNNTKRSSLITIFESVMNFKKWKPPYDWRFTTKQKWGFSALGVVLLFVATLLVLIFAGGPVLFRRAMEDAKFDIQSLKLDNFTPESLSIRMEMRVKMRDDANLALGPTSYILGTNNSLTPGHLHPSVEGVLSSLPDAPVFEPEATLFEKRFTREMAPHDMGNRIKVEDLGVMYRPGILGTFEAGGMIVAGGKGALEVASTVNLGVDGDLRLEDPRAWAGLLTALLYRERLELRVSGSVLGKFLWVWRRSDISKKLPINGMNGFKGFQIQNHAAFSSPSGQFSAELTWHNPSHVSLTLPRIELDLLAGGHKVGNSTISNMHITPGDNTITGFTGSLDPRIFRNNRTLLSRYLSGFIAQANGQEFSLLQLQGVAAIANNREVYWLGPAIERMTFDLPLIARDPAHPGPTNPLGESFKWDFVFVAGMSMIELTNGTLSMTLTLPFESAMFPVYIEDVRWDLTISNHQGPFLQIVRNFRSSSNEIVPLSANSHSIRSRLDKHTLVDVLGREIWNMYFTRDFVASTVVHLRITGNVTLEVVTPLGNATVSGLGVRDERWDMKGLGGLDNGGKSPAEVLYPIALEYRKWTVGFKIYNPSAIQVVLGASTFTMYTDRNVECFAVLKVNDLNLTRGWSNLSGVIEMDEGRCVSNGFGKFLSMVIAGGIHHLAAKFVDCQYSSAGKPFIAGFQLQKFNAVLHNIKYVLFDSLDIWVQQGGAKAIVTIANEIFPAVSFTLIDVAVLGLIEGAGINSTIKSTDFDSTKQLPPVALAFKSSAANTANDLHQFTGWDMKLGIEGKLGIDWNGIQTLIDYTQQDIPARVRGVMA